MKLEREKKDHVLQIRISKEMKEEIFEIAKENNVSVTRLLEYCFQIWKSNIGGEEE